MGRPSGKLSELSMDTLSARVWMRRGRNPGQNWAAREERGEKRRARERVLRAFGPRDFPESLSILTFPGLYWRFERQLLAARESKRVRNGERQPRRTYITAIEREEEIYRVSLLHMPGGESSLVAVPSAEYATQSVRTRQITRFHRATFERLAEVDRHDVDGAWLDFNGSITVNRMALVRRFWRGRVRRRLAITCAVSRYDAATSALLRERGETYEEWLLGNFADARILDVLQYGDGYPMIQFILDKRKEEV